MNNELTCILTEYEVRLCKFNISRTSCSNCGKTTDEEYRICRACVKRLYRSLNSFRQLE